jgi:hypothetical protein
MHYDNYAFSNNGQQTIVANNGVRLKPSYSKTDAEILTELDVQAIKTFYSCGSSPTTMNPVTTTAPNTIISTTNTARTITVASTTRPPITSNVPLTSLASTSTTSRGFVLYKFTINNKLSYPIKLYWISYQNEQILYAKINPGGIWTQSTYLTHKWLLKSDDNRYSKSFEIGVDSSFLSTNSIFNAQ